MAIKRPLFRNQTAAWVTGVAFVVAGSFCFHDAFGRRGQQAPWLTRLLTPGM